MTDIKQPKKPWGIAKVEFIALIPEVKKMIDCEYPKTKVYEYLAKDNKITMSYRRFCELICKTFPEKAGKSKHIKSKAAKNSQTASKFPVPREKNRTPKAADDTSKGKPFGPRDATQPYNTNM